MGGVVSVDKGPVMGTHPAGWDYPTRILAAWSRGARQFARCRIIYRSALLNQPTALPTVSTHLANLSVACNHSQTFHTVCEVCRILARPMPYAVERCNRLASICTKYYGTRRVAAKVMP